MSVKYVILTGRSFENAAAIVSLTPSLHSGAHLLTPTSDRFELPVALNDRVRFRLIRLNSDSESG